MRGNSTENSAVPQPGADPGGPRGAVVPIARVADLSQIGGAGVGDYFLWVPYLQNSVQQFLVGSAADTTAPAGLSVQLVQINGDEETELTEQFYLTELTVFPAQLDPPSLVIGAPVFLRVRTSATSEILLVTVHILVSEAL